LKLRNLHNNLFRQTGLSKIVTAKERNMNKKLRVLIIDDSADDTILLIRGLSRGGFEPEFERVETPEAMRAALHQTWDIIISDYAMPHFSGLGALSV
jgi:CheY-like chemotaxis protein